MPTHFDKEQPNTVTDRGRDMFRGH